MARHKKQIKGPWPIWKLVLADVLALGLALVVFALFHHVIPRQEDAVGTVSRRVSSVQMQAATQVPVTPTPVVTVPPEPTATVEPVVQAATPEATVEVTPEPTPEPTATPEPTPDPVGYFGTKYADKFTDGEVIREGGSYRSSNVNVTVTKTREKGADVYIADIYVKDISCLQAAFAKDKFGRGYGEWPWKIAERKGAIVTINGDFCGTRDNGVVIRNGILYRDEKRITRDVGVIYWDGSMECFSPNEFDTQTEMERGAYQAWNFGPMLLDKDGNSMEKFNSKVHPANPRASIGYYEPGHYCMVVADGRKSSSVGLSLASLSELYERLGCTAAYNLDGGGTAVMVCGSEVINDQAGDGRQCSDFVMIMDEIVEASEDAERG